MLSTEMLLKPRYKVIAEDTSGDFTIGSILTLTQDFNGYKNINSGMFHRIERIDKYPHLFRKLEWWEERKENDMPDYLKSVKSNLIVGVITWHTNHVTVGIQNDFFNREDIELTRKYLPATESEYNQYISTKEK
jgi:hypothetical protein